MKPIRVVTYQIHFYRLGKYVGTLPQGLTASTAMGYVECYNRMRIAEGMHATITSEQVLVRPPQTSPGPE